MPASPKGTGRLIFGEAGILNIQRTNTEGRYEVWLTKYLYDGVEKGEFPKNDLISGHRKVRISFESKVSGGTHTLRIVLKSKERQVWLAKEEILVKDNVWAAFRMYFQAPADEECQLRIDDIALSNAPSSVQIRNIAVAERT